MSVGRLQVSSSHVSYSGLDFYVSSLLLNHQRLLAQMENKRNTGSSLLDFPSNNYPSEGHDPFSLSFLKAPESQIWSFMASNACPQQKFLIPDLSALDDPEQSQRYLTSTLARTASDITHGQLQHIRHGTLRKNRNPIAFSLDLPTAIKLEESDMLATSHYAHTSTLSDDFSPSESSSPLRTTQRPRGGENEHSVLKNGIEVDDETLVSNDVDTRKHPLKAENDLKSDIC